MKFKKLKFVSTIFDMGVKFNIGGNTDIYNKNLITKIFIKVLKLNFLSRIYNI